MRSSRLLTFLVVCVVTSGCKTKGDADAAPDPAAVKAQQDLLARRDALLKARQQLQSERDKLDLEISDVTAKGGDASEQIKKRSDLDTQIKKSNVDDQLQEVNGKLDAIKLTGDKAAQVAAREADIGSREKTVGEREAKLAERERMFATRESESAQRWKDSCSTGAPVIIQQSAPKGGNYTKKDVSDMIGRAKTAMAKKGITTADLAGPAQSLEAEAGRALNDNDMSKAYFAAAQLVASVDATSINRAFIQAKHARLSALVKTSKVDEATNQQLAGILGDVMQKYNDGDFPAANKRLNQLAALLKQ